MDLTTLTTPMETSPHTYAMEPGHLELLGSVAAALPPGTGDQGDVIFSREYDELQKAATAAPEVNGAESGYAPRGGVKTADWAKVVKIGTDLLRNRSKDLRVAVKWAEGLARRDGLAGIAAALRGVALLISGSWQDLLPEIEDGDLGARAGNLEGLDRRLAPILLAALARGEVTPAAGFTIQSELNDLLGVSAERFARQVYGFNELSGALQRCSEQVRFEAPPPTEITPVAGVPVTAESPGPAGKRGPEPASPVGPTPADPAVAGIPVPAGPGLPAGRWVDFEELQRPVTAEAPQGDDLFADGSLDELRRLQTRPPAGSDDPQYKPRRGFASADFPKSATFAKALLTGKSKDLRVAGRLLLALTEMHGLSGASEGLAAIRILCESFQLKLHPRGDEGGADPYLLAQALKWADAECGLALRRWMRDLDTAGAREAYEDLPRLKDEIGRIESWSVVNLAKDAAQLLEIASAISKVEDHPEVIKVRITRATSATASAQASTPTQTEGGSGPTHSGASPATVASSGATPSAPAFSKLPDASFEITARDQAQILETVIARDLLNLRPEDPVSYFLIRALRWNLGSVNPYNQTLIPPKERVEELKKLRDSGSWNELLFRGEVLMREAWAANTLDLQRYAWEALGQMGEKFALARQAVAAATRMHIEQHKILEAKAKDPTGLPVADAATLTWLRTLGRGGSEDDGGSDHERWRDRIEETLGAGKIVETMAVIHEIRRNAGLTPRQIFRLQLHAARRLLTEKKPLQAKAVFDRIRKEHVDQHLDRWEGPSQMIEILKGLIECCNSREVGDGDGAQRRRYLEELCVIDPRYSMVNEGELGAVNF